jgi:anti-sigma regulatory factor (Ser/Thr protein kinase)
MDAKKKILSLVKSKKKATTQELTKQLKISRQRVSRHLSSLVREGLLSKTGSTRASVYSYLGKKSVRVENKVVMVKNLKGLAEEAIYSQIELRLGLKKLPANVQTIVSYAFTEMLNNAIDHSRAKKAHIEVVLDSEKFEFHIKDTGVGLFANVKGKFKLEDEYAAVEHVLKGKQTTFPEQHSGQGIFFTSRIADLFKIRSHKIELTKDNLNDDVRLKDTQNIRGTDVYFQIKKRSKKILRDLFKEYSNEEYEFDRTNVKIHLTAERELLARSQAKRLLLGLEQYKIITLDFSKVKEVGQAFVDEVFRVYQSRYPEIQIIYVNANPAVEFMIRRGLTKIAHVK